MKFLRISLLVVVVAAVTLRDFAAAGPAVLQYQEYLNLMQEKLEEQEQQRAREERSSAGTCSLFPYRYNVTDEDGCTGQIGLYGCSGRCDTGEIPTFYYSRYASRCTNSRACSPRAVDL